MNINIRSIALIVIALIIAGVTAMLARNLVTTSKPQNSNEQSIAPKAPVSKMKILVAAINIPIGHFIKDKDMVWQSWPDETVRDTYLQKNSKIKKESLIGSVANAAIYAGEPILSNRLVNPNNRGFMAAVLPVGLRAISVRITETSGNAGFIFPGDHVDLVLTHQIDLHNSNRKKARLSETVVSNVQVLAINQKTDDMAHTPTVGKTATLAVSAKDAEKVALMMKMGELTLVLRGLSPEKDPFKSTAAGKPSVTWDSDVSKQISARKINSPDGHNITVEVFRGGNGTTAATAQTVDFNQLLKPTLNAGKNKTNQDNQEEQRNDQQIP